jgi:hypothetical protein
VQRGDKGLQLKVRVGERPPPPPLPDDDQ